MFQVLNPIWLISMSAVAIPVVIHLWNVKQGKTLKIGSTVLLGESSRQNAKSIRLNELLLLILRCLLIILLAIVLAEPIWSGHSANNQKGWILAERPGFKETYRTFKPTIDSLLKAGHELHYLDTGFREALLDERLTDTLPVSPGLPYWPLLQLLEKRVPQNLPLHLFTSNSINRFTGKRPALALNLTWSTYTPKDSLTTWIEDAYLTYSDSIRVIHGESSPSATKFSYKTLRSTEHDSLVKLVVNNGIPEVSLKNSSNTNAIPVDTTTWRVGIYTDGYRDDVQYFRAALTAIRLTTGRKILITEVKGIGNISGLQYLFWLSERILPDNLLQKGLKVIAYVPGKPVRVNNFINIPALSTPVSLLKKVDKQSSAHETIMWKDGEGNAVLTYQEKGSASLYRLYSHISPQWNDLAWDANFPTLIAGLIGRKHTALPGNDKRIIPHDELMTSALETDTRHKLRLPDHIMPLTNMLWVAAFLLFAIERWLSYKQKTAPGYA